MAQGCVMRTGATLDVHPTSVGETPKMNGSIMLATADSIDDVWKLLREDVYTTSGVWNMDQVSPA